ncbi:ATP-dependent DNA helicase pif1 [Fusarium oxysporum f. sp. albedinis]|nr:ATP-dependent DNA helicase pif1 [Fusarium oxysporum f. sp. albedinis]
MSFNLSGPFLRSRYVSLAVYIAQCTRRQSLGHGQRNFTVAVTHPDSGRSSVENNNVLPLAPEEMKAGMAGQMTWCTYPSMYYHVLIIWCRAPSLRKAIFQLPGQLINLTCNAPLDTTYPRTIVANVIIGAHHQTRQDAPCQMSPSSNGQLSMPLPAKIASNQLFSRGSDKKQIVYTLSARLISTLANGSKCSNF